MIDAMGIRLAGAPNFRDVGGYLASDGRRVKRGQLFRSGDSGCLTQQDVDAMTRLGVKLIVDLRSDKECKANEIRWPIGDAEFIAANILADLRAGNQSIIDLLQQDPTPRGAGIMMETTYSVLPHALGPTLAQIARRIVEDDKLPVVFHCSIGRDRAGITAAMLLFALGVPRDTVIADYLRTNVYIDAPFIREVTKNYLVRLGTELDEETLDILTFARIEHFHAALRTVSVEYGTVTNYLDAIGIDAMTRTALQARLLE